jgi:DNA-binding transcriptional LysR family regulator
VDIRQIELFIVAAEEQHFTRAARRANIVQSGLSVAIRALEEELGTLLFVRTTRRVELSEAGRIFLPEARRIIQATRAARDAVAAVKGGLAGRLSIGTIPSLHPFLDLPLLLQEFRKRHPKVEIALREENLEQIVESLRRSRLDLAFMPLSGRLSGFAVDRLFSSALVLVVSPGHALAGRASVALSDLSGEVFIDFSPRWATRHLIDQIFAREDVVRRTEFEVENFDLLFQFVARDLAVAVVPEAMVAGRRLHHLRIASRLAGDAVPAWEIGLLRQRMSSELSSNPAADAFRAMILGVVRGDK